MSTTNQTEQPTKETSLADLKLAIERVPANPRFAVGDVEFDDLYRYEFQRAEAWRTAFEWHVRLIERHAALSDKVGAHITDWIAIDREEDEGKALLREKLR